MLKLSSVFTNEIDPFSPEYLVWNLEKMRKGNGRWRFKCWEEEWRLYIFLKVACDLFKVTWQKRNWMNEQVIKCSMLTKLNNKFYYFKKLFNWDFTSLKIETVYQIQGFIGFKQTIRWWLPAFIEIFEEKL